MKAAAVAATSAMHELSAGSSGNGVQMGQRRPDKIGDSGFLPRPTLPRGSCDSSKKDSSRSGRAGACRSSGASRVLLRRLRSTSSRQSKCSSTTRQRRCSGHNPLTGWIKPERSSRRCRRSKTKCGRHVLSTRRTCSCRKAPLSAPSLSGCADNQAGSPS